MNVKWLHSNRNSFSLVVDDHSNKRTLLFIAANNFPLNSAKQYGAPNENVQLQ